MHRKILSALTLICALCATAAAQDAKSVVEAAIKSIGDVKSVQYSGSGAQFNLGQSVSPDTAWPRTELKSFTRTVDYDKPATRNETTNAQGVTATQFLAGDKAWQASANPTPASPAVTVERQLQIWLTPHGFLNGALANKATAKKSGKVTLVTFTALGKYRVVGAISADNLVEKVETRLYSSVLGDMLVETTYSDYRDFDGFKFPAKITQKQGAAHAQPRPPVARKEESQILAIDAKHVMSDSARTVELHHIQDNPHNTGIIMAWLLKEKLLVEVDVYSPLPPNATPPDNPNPNIVNLYENIQRLNLDVNRIVPLHGRIVDLAELKRTIGR